MKPARMALSMLVLSGLVMPEATTAQSGGQSEAVIALHVQAHAAKGLACASLDTSLACSDYTTEWPVHQPADVYLVVARARTDLGISGLTCGVRYGEWGSMSDGVGCDVFGYTACHDLEYTSFPGVDCDSCHAWPASGEGDRMLWLRSVHCQRNEIGSDGVHAVAGAFYVYAYGAGEFAVTPNKTQSPPEFQVVDCSWPPLLSDLSFPAAAGIIRFGEPGYNPCTALIPTVRTTWGKIKQQRR